MAWVPPGDPQRSTLLRAVSTSNGPRRPYEKNAIGIPAFLIGGAAVSSVSQGVRRGVNAAAGSRVGVAVAVVVTFLLLAAASWLVLQGAAVARRRIKLSLDQALAAL